MKKDYQLFVDFILENKDILKYISNIEQQSFERIMIHSKYNNGNRKKLFSKYDIGEIKNKLQTKSFFKFNIDNAYLLKGGVLFSGKTNVIGTKAFKEIDGKMKFLIKDYSKNFIKTIDSNIKYMIYLDFIINNNDCLNLFTKIFNKENINELNFKDFSFIITKDNFIELFNFFEYGILANELNISDKYVISNLSNNTLIINKISIKKIDLTNLVGEDIDVKFTITNKNYFYFSFYNNGKLVYILSHRSFKDGKGYPQGNCAFISKEYIKEKIINL